MDFNNLSPLLGINIKGTSRHTSESSSDKLNLDLKGFLKKSYLSSPGPKPKSFSKKVIQKNVVTSGIRGVFKKLSLL